MVCGKTAVAFAASTDTYKLNHSGCNTAKIILHAAFTFYNRYAHFFAYNFNKLFVYVFDFGHYAFIEIIFLAELFTVICIFEGFENI